MAAVLLLVTCCARELLWGKLAAMVLGLVIGLLPQIVYTMQHAAESGPTAMAAFQPQGMSTLTQLPARLGAQLIGTLLVSLPDMTGPGWLCTASVGRNGLPTAWADTGALACAGLRVGWSLGLVTLGVLAGVTAFGVWRASIRASRTTSGLPMEYRMAVLHFAQLMLLLGGGLTLVMYGSSPAAIHPGTTRYLIGMDVSLPALVYPLWSGGIVPWLGARAPRRLWLRRTSGYCVCLGLVLLTLMGGVVSTYTLAPAAHAQYMEDQTLIRDLGKLGIRHMYTDYWTCYKVAFLAEEQLTCDVLGRSLEQGNNRYLPYVAPVEADPRAAYVFPANSPQTADFVGQMGTSSSRFIQIRLDNYVVYLPR